MTASRGVALLEVLIAMVLIAISGIALMNLVREATTISEELAQREREILEASALLRGAVSTIRLGRFRFSEAAHTSQMRIVATPTADGLWRVAVVDQHSGREVMVTHVRHSR